MAAAGRAAGRRGAVRQAVAADPGVVHRRHRRARRPPAGDRQPDHPHRPGRDHRGRGPGADPAGGGDRLADRRAGAHRRDGVGRDRAGDQRAHRPVPPLPDPGRPADRPGALRLAGRPRADLPGRRLEQHGALLPAGRRHRRDARPDRRPGGLPPRPGGAGRRRADRRRDRRLGGRAHRRQGGVPGGRRHRHRRVDVDGPGQRAGAAAGDPRLGRLLPAGRGQAGPGPTGMPGAALPARAPRRGDHRRGDRRAEQRGLGAGGEPAARAEGALAWLLEQP